MKIVARTDKGMLRDNNQDSYAAGELAGNAIFSVVCDGMGGAAEGAFASAEAVRVIREKITSVYYEGMSDLSVKGMLISALENANRRIYELSLSNEKYNGMGTTVVAAVATDSFVYYVHAGDSRAYRVEGGALTQLTKDHTVVQRMLERGEITPQEAEEHPNKHIITRALGAEEKIRIDYGQDSFEDDEVYILCSDGLTNYTKPNDLVELTSDGHYYEYADRLVNLANQNGGGDNITVVAFMK